MRVGRLRFASGLAYLHCPGCGETTLHKLHRCIHCGHHGPVSIEPTLTVNERQRLGITNAARNSRKRAPGPPLNKRGRALRAQWLKEAS